MHFSWRFCSVNRSVPAVQYGLGCQQLFRVWKQALNLQNCPPCDLMLKTREVLAVCIVFLATERPAGAHSAVSSQLLWSVFTGHIFLQTHGEHEHGSSYVMCIFPCFSLKRAWLQYQHSRQERELSPLDVTLLAVINSFGFVRVGCHSIIKGVYGDNPLISPSTHSLSTRKQIASVLTERDCKGYPKLEG